MSALDRRDRSRCQMFLFDIADVFGWVVEYFGFEISRDLTIRGFGYFLLPPPPLRRAT